MPGRRRAALAQSVTLLDHVLSGKDPVAPALMAEAGALSHGALAALIDRLARRLRAVGLGGRERVLVQYPNAPEQLIAVLGTMAAGGVAVPLPPDASGERVRYVAVQSGARASLAPSGGAVVPGLARFEVAVDVGAGSVDLSAEGATDDRPRADTSAGDASGDLALVLYSAGSTGRPKGVALGHGQLTWTARTLARSYRIDRQHRELILVSLAHSDGLQRALATLGAGGAVALSEGPLSVSGIMEDIVRYEARGFFAPSPLVRMMLMASRARTDALARCHTIETGSAPLTSGEVRALMDAAPNARVFVHYGLTECSRAVILDARAHPDRLDTVGRASSEVDISVRDAEGRPLGADARGEIALRGPQLAHGYWGQPELSGERFRDGWLSTGDYGMLDDEGFLRLLGREDDLINSAGHHFFPAEVENELGPIPGVAEYLVAGVPDPRGVLGEVPWAFVVPADASQWVPGPFLAAVRDRLPAHMRPRQVVAVASLPRTASGKPSRRRTVEMHGPAR